VAVIDTGVYYLHPALGGCFGPGCKVGFGYGKWFEHVFMRRKIRSNIFLDLVGDAYNGSNTAVPDNDPLDNCSDDSHGICQFLFYSSTIDYIHSIGTHVSGIIAANITGIDQATFIPDVPFIGIAPQVTLGACEFAQFSLFKTHLVSLFSSKRSCVRM
jgi:subtilisin family serine protease